MTYPVAPRTHFGDPCIHCGIPHDDVPPGPCTGDASKAKVLAYCCSRQAWQNPGNECSTYTCHMSDGSFRDEALLPRYGIAHARTKAWDDDGAICLSVQDFYEKRIVPSAKRAAKATQSEVK